MFCAYCGKEVQDGAAFCPHCGKQTITAPSSQSSVAAQPAPAKKPRNRIAIIIAAVVAVVLIVVACVFAFSCSQTSANAISHDTDKRVVVSMSAPITVRDAQDKPLSNYSLVVVREDESMHYYDISGESFTFEAIGEDPGNVHVFERDYDSNFASDLPVDEVVTADDAAIRSESADSNNEEVITEAATLDTKEPEQDDTLSNANRAAYMALYAKLLELEDTYGSCEVVTSSGGQRALDGVGALWFDMDQDGIEEMITVALDADADASKGTGNVEKYTVTLWRYDSSTCTVENLHETILSHFTNGENAYVLIHTDEDGYLSIGTRALFGAEDPVECTAFGYSAADEKFEETYNASCDFANSDTGQINGEQIASSDFYDKLSDWLNETTRYSILDSTRDTSGTSTPETVEAMQEEERQMKELAFATSRSTAEAVVQSDDEEQSAQDAVADELFSQIPSSFTHASGVGAWAASLEVSADGTYIGQVSDMNMGETGSGYPGGTIYVGKCSGTFTNVTKVDDYTYTMEIGSETGDGAGSETIENDRRYVTSEYSLGSVGDVITVYLPGRSTADISDDVLSWNLNADRDASTLQRWCIVFADGSPYYSD